MADAVGYLSPSLRLLRARPLPLLALGLAFQLSALSAFCGLGLLTTPLLGCEILRLQLRASGATVGPRARTYLSAGLLLFAMGSVPLSVCWLPLWLAGGEHAWWVVLPLSILLLAVALLVLLPLVYAPIILLQGGPGLASSAQASATQVRRTGPFRAFWATASALALGCLPIVGPALGLGMLVRAQQAGDASTASPSPSPGIQRRLVGGLLGLLLLGPAVLVFLGASLVSPSVLPGGSLPVGLTVVADEALPPSATRTVSLPGTSLVLRLDARRASLSARDGGGVGELPLPPGTRIQGFSLAGHGPDFAIELRTATGPRLTFVDVQGVRLDDSLSVRLAQRPPWPCLAWFLLSVCLSLFSLFGSTKRRI